MKLGCFTPSRTPISIYSSSSALHMCMFSKHVFILCCIVPCAIAVDDGRSVNYDFIKPILIWGGPDHAWVGAESVT